MAIDLVKELHLDKMTDEEKNEVLVQFTDSLLKRLMVRIYEELNEADKKELDRLMDKNDPNVINDFLAKKNPNLDSVRDEETAGLVSEMKDFIK